MAEVPAKSGARARSSTKLPPAQIAVCAEKRTAETGARGIPLGPGGGGEVSKA